MYNRVILVGNLTRDIELRYTSSGTAIAKTGIATTRKFKSSGEAKEEVVFIDLTFFGRQAEVANQYLKKGSKILADGRLILEQWVSQDGTKRSKHSVAVESMQMLDTKSSNGQGKPNAHQSLQQGQGSYSEKPNNLNNSGYNQTKEPTIPEIDIDEDSVPF